MRIPAVLLVLLGVVAAGCGGEDSNCVMVDAAAPGCVSIDSALAADAPAGITPDALAGADARAAVDAFDLGDATEQELYDRLYELLSAPGALKIPPVGQQYAANQLTTAVTRVSASSGLATLTEAEVPALLSYFDVSGNTILDLVSKSDLHLTVRSGWREGFIAEAIVAAVADSGTAAEVAAILAALPADFVQLQAYDLGAEITAKEIFFVLPSFSTSALRIALTYVEA